MACSNPLKIYDPKPSLRKNHADFHLNNLRRSFNEESFVRVPCRYCLNCRVDRQNEFVDRAEYEYIQYGCGAFVTFTYDDVHNFKNAFINAKTGEITYSINKKDGKDFLNRLNKLVHNHNKELRKKGIKYNPLCRDDYKYVITSEYGDSFGRNHFHCLFFGLDFAYCERLFWKAWRYQGAIEVGAIKNGGIAYCVKYITDQQFGSERFYKYDYMGLTAPSSSHSLGFGEGLYKSQLKYIKEHNGNYHWHHKDRPVPSYYKNKYKIISDLNLESYEKRYKVKCDNIYNLYEHRITSYKDFQAFNLDLAQRRQKNLEINLVNHGKPIVNRALMAHELHDMIYTDNHRLNPKLDNWICRVVKPDGSAVLKINNETKSYLTTRDLMKLHTDYKTLQKMYGFQKATEMIFPPDYIPF